jgi:hypothetical protein
MSLDGLVNDGVVFRPGDSDPSQPRTFIVTGVARGGTSLVAGLLAEAGVYMGEDVLDLINEDREILHALHGRHPGALDDIIARRNKLGRAWGFKMPILSSFLTPLDLARFRNLHLLVVFRDPIAIGVRQAISEYESPLVTMANAARAMSEMAILVEQTNCPALMLSYEKCITFPQVAVDNLMAFGGFGASPDLRQRLLNQVRPNDKDYVARIRRVINGNIDGLMGTKLCGWCWDQISREAFTLDICFDGTKIADIKSDKFRQDLQEAGLGDGRYGFAIDLAPLGVRPDTIISVNVTGKTYTLPQGGTPLSLMRGYVPSCFGAVSAT